MGGVSIIPGCGQGIISLPRIEVSAEPEVNGLTLHNPCRQKKNKNIK
jgi:hypothetical protein